MVFVMGRSLERSVQGRQDERNEFLRCDEECIQPVEMNMFAARSSAQEKRSEG